MKRSWLITIIYSLLLLGLGAVVIFMPQVVPMDKCSDLYKRYANIDGIEATFIKDYRVNDSVTVDVTLLEATTDSAWGEVLQYFGVPDISLEDIDPGFEMFLRLVNRKDYTQSQDSVLLNNDVMSISYTKKTIGIFKTETLSQYLAVTHSKYDEMIDKNARQQ